MNAIPSAFSSPSYKWHHGYRLPCSQIRALDSGWPLSAPRIRSIGAEDGESWGSQHKKTLNTASKRNDWNALHKSSATMTRLWKLILRSPIRSCHFIWAFSVQTFLIFLQRILQPSWPQYQSLRLQLQRAYWSSSSYYYPEIIHRLPVTDCPPTKACRVGSSWSGYLIPGTTDLASLASSSHPCHCIAVYAHGGGYARGEARMYLNYMDRWTEGAKRTGIDLAFLSVEYRKKAHLKFTCRDLGDSEFLAALTHEASHPAQRQAFVKAYRYLLAQGISPTRIIFMGDSAGGGLCVLSAIEAQKQGLPQPAGSVLVSPWIDMGLACFQGGNALVQTDYIVGANLAVPSFTAAWLDGAPGTSADVNPLYRDPDEIATLNPLLILVGGGEFALQEGKDLAALCNKAGLPHHLEVEWGQLHLYGLGSKWIDPSVRLKTDAMIFNWIRDCLSSELRA